jgi:predicted amidophosphoribosyltransferase
MALIPCPACGRQVSEAAPTCPGCGHPIAVPKGATFKDALTRPESVQSGFTVLGLFVTAPWIARIIALILFVGLAAWVVAHR